MFRLATAIAAIILLDFLPSVSPASARSVSPSTVTAQLIPDRCNRDVFANATPIDTLFSQYPLQLVNYTDNQAVSHRLGYYFSLDPHLRQALEAAFESGLLTKLTIEVVTQQELYRDQAEAQNSFDSTTKQAVIRLADQYVIGDYETPCALSLAGIENEFSEVILRARYYATHNQPLRPSVYQESATLALSSLASLVFQGETFASAESVRIVLQDVLAISQRRYANNTALAISSPDRDSAYVADWLNERLSFLLPSPFIDGQVKFVVDVSANRGNIIRPTVTIE